MKALSIIAIVVLVILLAVCFAAFAGIALALHDELKDTWTNTDNNNHKPSNP